MAVQGRGLAVGRPPGVGHSRGVDPRLVERDLGLPDELAQARDLADLLVHEHLGVLVAIDLEAYRICGECPLEGD